MIGLMFFGALGLWGLAAIYLGRKLPQWFKLNNAWSWLFVPVVFFAPALDEVIGRWQFKQLCEKEAVIWLSPDWKRVEAARAIRHPFVKAGGTVIPIEVQRSDYVDVATGKLFMFKTGLHTKGGLLMSTFGLGLGVATSCWPSNRDEVSKMIEIDKLITQGETK